VLPSSVAGNRYAVANQPRRGGPANQVAAVGIPAAAPYVNGQKQTTHYADQHLGSGDAVGRAAAQQVQASPRLPSENFAPALPQSAPLNGVATAPATPATREQAIAPRAPTTEAIPPAPLGLEGYCPVTLKDSKFPPDDPRRWVPGDPRWGAKHRGRTYLFVGKEERDRFLLNQNADTYAPVLSGMDPVLAFGSGQLVAGKREFGVWYNGLVYMFSSEQTLQQFTQNREFYAASVRQAMHAGRPTTLR